MQNKDGQQTQQADENQIANEVAQPDQATPAVQSLSSMPLSGWKGSITTFKGFTGTLPVLELNDAAWGEIVQIMAPEEPTSLVDKGQGHHGATISEMDRADRP